VTPSDTAEGIAQGLVLGLVVMALAFDLLARLLT